MNMMQKISLASGALWSLKGGWSGLVDWAAEQAKKIATQDNIRNLAHKGNKELAEKVKIEGDKKAVIDMVQEANDVQSVYVASFADDGSISEKELADCDAAIDKPIDKYLTDANLAAAIDWIASKLKGGK